MLTKLGRFYMVVCSEIEVREFLEFVGFLEEEEEEEEKNISCV